MNVGPRTPDRRGSRTIAPAGTAAAFTHADQAAEDDRWHGLDPYPTEAERMEADARERFQDPNDTFARNPGAAA